MAILRRSDVVLGTPYSAAATRALLLGSGELGKEVAIELQRLGVEVIAVDRYPDAPAMAVAHRSHVIDMLDGEALRSVIEAERPAVVIPEIEAIDTATLAALESEGVTRVAPTAQATVLTMDREGIRRLAAEELGLPTSRYVFADTEEEMAAAVAEVGVPCVVKPVMSSSGKGQSVVRDQAGAVAAWAKAQGEGRASGHGAQRVIVEAFVDFDYEITLLTVRHRDGTTFCEPIGHTQVAGDYRESWQPAPMPQATWEAAQKVAAAITDALGGWGLFGVELFVRGAEVLFSEVSPRPHDTGLVTLVSQDLSEFALHARAVLGLPVPPVLVTRPGASAVVLATGDGVPRYHGLVAALTTEQTQVRIFGKPEVHGQRRVAVALATAGNVEDAREAARSAASAIRVDLD